LNQTGDGIGGKTLFGIKYVEENEKLIRKVYPKDVLYKSAKASKHVPPKRLRFRLTCF